MKVYKCENVTKSDTLLSEFENQLMINCTKITPFQAVDLVKNYADNIKETELVEILEKIIAHGATEICDSEGTSALVDVLEVFLNTTNVRPKMISNLIGKITNEIDDLSTQEQCEFLKMLGHVLDENTHHTGEVYDVTIIQAVLETVEPYISSKLSVMNFKEMSDAFVGFSHPHASERLAILDTLESQLIELL